ncbi:hypothetical protein CYMTET_16200 [Cymbomonas tetramitiformis]|uniref:DUF8204 domain-containing protein n=1 Tax=Cymbomonas tetramitiformis TaxID=36881 RepID=A0AAE0GCV7_9CHLO|nr:hypothetical protein CYMTET_16200 [Cymbomonas tetramitiformis]
MPEPEKTKCCTGALFYSTEMANRKQPPFCAGIPWKTQEDLSGKNSASDAVGNSSFKYTCIGYSEHKTLGENDVKGKPRLPYCEGVEVIMTTDVKQPKEQEAGRPITSPVESPKAEQDISKAPPVVPTAPSALGSGIASLPVNEFPERFMRSAGRITLQMEKNLKRYAKLIGRGVSYLGFGRDEK